MCGVTVCWYANQCIINRNTTANDRVASFVITKEITISGTKHIRQNDHLWETPPQRERERQRERDALRNIHRTLSMCEPFSMPCRAGFNGDTFDSPDTPSARAITQWLDIKFRHDHSNKTLCLKMRYNKAWTFWDTGAYLEIVLKVFRRLLIFWRRLL